MAILIISNGSSNNYLKRLADDDFIASPLELKCPVDKSGFSKFGFDFLFLAGSADLTGSVGLTDLVSAFLIREYGGTK